MSMNAQQLLDKLKELSEEDRDKPVLLFPTDWGTYEIVDFEITPNSILLIDDIEVDTRKHAALNQSALTEFFDICDREGEEGS